MPFVTEKNLTDIVLDRWSSVPDPRLRQIMTSLIKHLHSFVREIEPTEAEWFTAIDWLTRTGQLSTDKRQEFILTSDVLGVSMLVDAINHRFSSKATPTTVTGPFHIHESPEFADGADMANGAPGIPCFVHGKVADMDGRPVANVMLDVWQTDGEGLYEAQRPEITDTWMRGIYHSKADGSYLIRTVAPIGYTIPLDGTVGEVFARNNISPYRPAHIHFMIKAPGFHAVTTHLFQRGDQYIESDVVYGVKEPLIVEFEKKSAGSKAPNGEIMNEPFYEVRYDFTLQRLAQAAAA
jgi:hydroxyquinol 1,2-dioxygenase